MVLVSSGAIAAGLAPLGLPRRPRDLATQQAAASVGQGLLVARYTRGVRPARRAHRAGAAQRGRPDAPRALPQRPADAGPAAGAGCAADRQRERHGGHRRDQVRRQRPAGRAGRARGPGRRAGPAVRRGRPVRRRPAAARRAAHPRGAQPGRPGRGHPGPGQRHRGHRGGHRRHGDQGGRGPDRHRGGHPDRGGERRRGAVSPGRAAGRDLLRAGRAASRGAAAVAGPRGRRPGQPAARRRGGGRDRVGPRLPAACGDHRRGRWFRGGRPGRPVRPGGPGDRPRPGQLRRHGDPGDDGPVYPRPGRGTRAGVRAGDRAPGRPGAAGRPAPPRRLPPPGGQQPPGRGTAGQQPPGRGPAGQQPPPGQRLSCHCSRRRCRRSRRRHAGRRCPRTAAPRRPPRSPRRP